MASLLFSSYNERHVFFLDQLLLLFLYIADPVDDRQASTTGSPKACIGVMKKRWSIYINREDLTSGTWTIEHPGSVNSECFKWLFICITTWQTPWTQFVFSDSSLDWTWHSWFPISISNLLNKIHLLQPYQLVALCLYTTCFYYRFAFRILQ